MRNRFLKKKSEYYNSVDELLEKLSIKLSNREEEEPNEKYAIKKQCQVCKNHDFKYICPKCKVLYCSLNCYTSHNNKCTEEFYKSNVIEELKATKVDEDSAKKFRYNLKNFYNKLNETNGDILDNENINKEYENKRILHFEDLLTKLDSGTFDINNDLSKQDWDEFKEFINSGNEPEVKFGNLYKPFWLREPYSLDIYDLTYFNSLSENELEHLRNFNVNQYKEYFPPKNSDEDNNSDSDSEIDESEIISIRLNEKEQIVDYDIINKSIILKWNNVKLLNSLTKAQPSEKNLYQLIVFVLTTIYIFRLFNGEFNENYEDVLNYIFTIAPLLSTKTTCVPENFESSINYICGNMKIIEGNNIKETKKLIIKDIIELLLGSKSFLFESLIRLYELIHASSQEKNISKKIINQCILAKHKLIYYMSYLKSNVKNEQIVNLQREINLYLKEKIV